MSQDQVTVGDWVSEETKTRLRAFASFLGRASDFLPAIFLVLVVFVILVDIPERWFLTVVIGPFVLAVLIATAERIAFRGRW